MSGQAPGPPDGRSQRERMLAGELYIADDPQLAADSVWLGGGVIVGPGVSIGENTVVGAGAVVVRDLPANVLAVGNPARVIRSL
jgi:maltose O-acetyltransferase